MQSNHYEVYAEFLIECRKAMGPLDFEKLAFDDEYQFEFFNRVLAGANSDILDMADLISRELEKEVTTH
jgi:hypothetical protein